MDFIASGADDDDAAAWPGALAVTATAFGAFWAKATRGIEKSNVAAAVTILFMMCVLYGESGKPETVGIDASPTALMCCGELKSIYAIYQLAEYCLASQNS